MMLCRTNCLQSTPVLIRQKNIKIQVWLWFCFVWTVFNTTTTWHFHYLFGLLKENHNINTVCFPSFFNGSSFFNSLFRLFWTFICHLRIKKKKYIRFGNVLTKLWTGIYQLRKKSKNENFDDFLLYTKQVFSCVNLENFSEEYGR